MENSPLYCAVGTKYPYDPYPCYDAFRNQYVCYNDSDSNQYCSLSYGQLYKYDAFPYLKYDGACGNALCACGNACKCGWM